jgi:hypothetical protein
MIDFFLSSQPAGTRSPPPISSAFTSTPFPSVFTISKAQVAFMGVLDWRQGREGKFALRVIHRIK